MNRETKEIKIADHTIVVKAYATGREAHTIRQAYFIGTKVEVVGDQPKINDLNTGAQFEVEKELIGQMVVSLDGATDNLVDRCLDLRSEVYDELVAQLDDLVAKKKK